MQIRGTPYGEARRLRYFVLMSCELLKSSSVDMDFFIDKFLGTTQQINPELKKYVRQTGIVQSRRVAKNYLEFANWLGFIKIDGRIVVPNSYTVLLSNLDGRLDFSLSEREKLAFFLKLAELDDFIKLICSLRVSNSVKQAIDNLNKSEHFVESYFEWMIDLGLLKAEKPRFGKF